MHQKNALVLPSTGLGDGCLFLSLCYNLAKAGYNVDCVHTKLSFMKDWIPSYRLYSREEFDFASKKKEGSLIIINEDSSTYTQNAIKHLRGSNLPFSSFAPSSRRSSLISQDPPIFFRRELSFLKNLEIYFQNLTNIALFEKKTGITSPEIPKDPHAVAIHASASSPIRQWPLERFMKVYSDLQKMGYRPSFVFWHSPEELNLVKTLGGSCENKVFSEIKLLATFLKSCSYFIGNDSGIGHLASSLGVPTLTLFNCPRKKILWKPGYTRGVGIAPSKWIPNMKGFRFRNYAFLLIFPWQVIRKFIKLQKKICI